MKNLIISTVYRFLFVFVFSLGTILAVAQDQQPQGNDGSSSSSSTTITRSTTTTSEWYTQPWVWVVGGAVFLIILVALLRGNSADREVSRTTVVKDRT